MHARRLITTHQPRKPRIPDIWCHGFSRHLGRALTPAERSVISRLEQNRRSRPPTRHDHRPTRPRHHSHPAQLPRLQARHITPGSHSHTLHPSRPARIRRNKRLRHITYRQADHIRGTTPAFMMLLNAHQAKTYSPPPARPAQLQTTLFSTLPHPRRLRLPHHPPSGPRSPAPRPRHRRLPRSPAATTRRPAARHNHHHPRHGHPHPPAGRTPPIRPIGPIRPIRPAPPTLAVHRAPQPKAKPHGKRPLTYCTPPHTRLRDQSRRLQKIISPRHSACIGDFL